MKFWVFQLGPKEVCRKCEKSVSVMDSMGFQSHLKAMTYARGLEESFRWTKQGVFRGVSVAVQGISKGDRRFHEFQGPSTFPEALQKVFGSS